jgi:BirA family biotin operon repressor/biotin-[acetyl-CoA-carboxylase] ligase
VSAPSEKRLEVEAVLEDLRAELPARVIGRRIEHLPQVGSTNDRARELAAAGEPEGLVVVADEQTLGRGRGGRVWHSAPGLGLYVSVVLRPRIPPAGIPRISLVAAVAGADALREASGLPVRIKWPNDLVRIDPQGRKRKLGGVLTEGRAGIDGVRDVVVGMGINVNHAPEDFPPELRGRATSLRAEMGRPIGRSEVLKQVLRWLDQWYRAWTQEGIDPVLDAYRERAVDLSGRAVRVRGGEESQAWDGVTAGLEDDGSLRVRPSGSAQDAGRPVVLVRHGDVDRVEEA